MIAHRRAAPALIALMLTASSAAADPVAAKKIDSVGMKAYTQSVVAGGVVSAAGGDVCERERAAPGAMQSGSDWADDRMWTIGCGPSRRR